MLSAQGLMAHSSYLNSVSCWPSTLLHTRLHCWIAKTFPHISFQTLGTQTPFWVQLPKELSMKNDTKKTEISFKAYSTWSNQDWCPITTPTLVATHSLTTIFFNVKRKTNQSSHCLKCSNHTSLLYLAFGMLLASIVF